MQSHFKHLTAYGNTANSKANSLLIQKLTAEVSKYSNPVVLASCLPSSLEINLLSFKSILFATRTPRNERLRVKELSQKCVTQLNRSKF